MLPAVREFAQSTLRDSTEIGDIIRPFYDRFLARAAADILERDCARVSLTRRWLDLRNSIAITNCGGLQTDVFRDNLASCLDNICNRLSEIDLRQDALHAAQKAVDLRRQLNCLHPKRYQSDLAMSLKNSVRYLSEVWRPQDALRGEQEALDADRQLLDVILMAIDPI